MIACHRGTRACFNCLCVYRLYVCCVCTEHDSCGCLRNAELLFRLGIFAVILFSVFLSSYFFAADVCDAVLCGFLSDDSMVIGGGAKVGLGHPSTENCLVGGDLNL